MKMRTRPFVLMFLLVTTAALGSVRATVSFDDDWRFFKGDVAGAEGPAFDDATWRALNVPHDWSIEGPFDQANPSGPAGAYLPCGTGWYRKHFVLPASDAKKRVFIDFDGVMANSDVWINGFHLGRRPNGYVSFRYELTEHLNFGDTAPNVIAVRVDNSAQPASRWYSGAGIYRHVRLAVTAPTRTEHWATFVTTPNVNSELAVIHVESQVVNQSDARRTVSLMMTLLKPDGTLGATVETAARPIGPGETANFTQELNAQRPDLWDLDHPALYRLLIRVRSGNETLDDEIVRFGVRDYRFDAATGFWLNGRNVKIKGVCLHHDGGAVGSAVPLQLWERRLALLKQVGVNAIRTSHNPVAPEFLDLCDRIGFLVMDEMFDSWMVQKEPYDYHLYFQQWSQIDVRDTVHRDRNHPSVIIYSAGNEIRDMVHSESAKATLRSLLDTFHEADPSRPVTQALFRPNVSHDYANGLADMLDVVGQNYRENEILAAHAAVPQRKVLGTENTHDRKAWLALRDNAPYAGQFLWTGVDYLGEAQRWPEIASDFGLLDRTGHLKARGYERQSWWSNAPMVHIVRRVAPPQVSPTDPGYDPPPQRQVQTLFSDWTPADGSPQLVELEVYSNCEQVDVLLNGRSLGAKPHPSDETPLTWSVAFEPGVVRAECRNRGKIAATDEQRTAGGATRIVLSADRNRLSPQSDDVSFLTATIVDEHGTPVPSAANLVSFRIDAGPGKIIAVDNADNMSHEPFQAQERHAFQGLCIAILRATATFGSIRVTASSPGLAAAAVTVDTYEK